jgi:integrase
MAGLHIVERRRKRDSRWYIYAWRGGPCIQKLDGSHGEKPTITPEVLAAQARAKQEHLGPHGNTLDRVIQAYQGSPEFTAKRHSTKKDYRLWLSRISAHFGSASLAAFEDRRMRGDILDWRDQWAAQPRTADKAVVMMATLLNWAMERGHVSINIAAGIKQLHHVNKADQVWEDRHWDAIASAPKHLLDALKLAHLTGLRLGDLVRVSWEHVHDKAIIITTRKRNGRAVIPIISELRQHLEAREHRSGTILRNSRGKPWTESGLGSVFQKHQPKGFDRTIHDLRGTYATWLAKKGLTDQEIARIIGWTAQRVSEIRARYVDEAQVVVTLVDRLSG